MTTLANLTVDVDVDADGVDRGVKKAEGALRGFGSRAEKDSDKLGGKIASALTGSLASSLKPTALAIGTGFSAQVVASIAGGLASGIVKAVQGLGSVLALLPAIALAGGVALGTLKLAMFGVSDALKAGLTGDTEKFEEALAKLPGPAQAVVRELVGLKAEFDLLRHVVQSNFFGPLIGQIRPLAETYFPALVGTLGGTASAFGAVIARTIELLRTPAIVRAITGALDNARVAVGNLLAGIPNLVRAFIPLVSVGSTFLPGLTQGFEGATARLAAFMQEAERTGRLRDFIQRGIDSLRSLWETTKQVGRIFENLGGIAIIVFDQIGFKGGGLLDTLERLSARALAFFQTGAGRNLIGEALDMLWELANNFFGTLQMIWPVIQPLIPKIVEFVSAFLGFKVALISAVLPFAVALANVLLPILTRLLEWVSGNTPAMIAIVTLLGIRWAVMGTQSTVAAAQQIAAWTTTAAAAAQKGATVIAQMAGVIAGWVTAGAKAALHGAQIVAAWALMGVQALLHAAKVALAWVISMGPIAIVVAAVAAAVFLIIKYWDEISGAITAAVNFVLDFVKRNWPLILAILTGPIGIAVGLIVKYWDEIWGATTWVFGRIADFFGAVIGRILDAFGWLVDRVVGAFEGLVSFLGRIPGWIWQALSGIGGLLWDIGKWILDSLIDGIEAGIGGLKNVVGGIAGSIVSWKGPIEKDRKLLIPEGGAIMEGLITGITRMLPALRGELHGVSDMITGTVGTEIGAQVNARVAVPPPGEPNRVVFDFTGADRDLGRALRKMVRVDGRGDVGEAFG